ncbi:MAG: LD-carboxypeptidase [Ginsengibacter sp.]
MIIPPYLKKNDTIGIVCPSGYMPVEKTLQAQQSITEWGFKIQLGLTVGNQHNYFSGDDEQRLHDLQQMLDDKNIKAIFCARGGYGLSRIIDKLSFKKFKKSPKWIVGFSDITVLHYHLLARLNTACLHAPMAAAFNGEGYKNIYIDSLKDALYGKRSDYTAATHFFNKHGKAKGRLIGGNLSIIAHLTGTPSQVKTKGKILFIEDVGEYIYNIDRMLQQLKRSGQLKNLAGLIIGGITDMKDTTIPYGQSVEEVIKDVVASYDYPVCFNFPVSHDTENFALKCGLKHELNITTDKVTLVQIQD